MQTKNPSCLGFNVRSETSFFLEQMEYASSKRRLILVTNAFSETYLKLYTFSSIIHILTVLLSCFQQTSCCNHTPLTHSVIQKHLFYPKNHLNKKLIYCHRKLFMDYVLLLWHLVKPSQNAATVSVLPRSSLSPRYVRFLGYLQ